MKTRNQTVSFDLSLFRKNLLIVRLAKGLGSKELAVKAGLKAMKRIYDLEEGRGTPSLDEIFSICQVLNVSMDDMLMKEAKVSLSFEFPIEKGKVNYRKS